MSQRPIYKSEHGKVKRFDSNIELLDFVRSIPNPHLYSQNDDSWAGASFTSVLDRLLHVELARVDHIIDRVDHIHENIVSPGVPLPVASVAGSVPRISAVVSGHPKTMYRRQRSEQMQVGTPITIYVDICLSASYSAQQLADRGAAIL